MMWQITAAVMAMMMTGAASAAMAAEVKPWRVPVEAGECLAEEVTRYDAIVRLWELAGCPEAGALPTAILSGGDRGRASEELLAAVPEDARAAFRWAAAELLLPENFVSRTDFGAPGIPTTPELRGGEFLCRAEFAGLLHRFAEMRGQAPLMWNDEIDAVGIADMRETIVEARSYLREAAWCVREGILTLDAGGNFNGGDTVTADVMAAALDALDAAIPADAAIYPAVVAENAAGQVTLSVTEAAVGEWVAFTWESAELPGEITMTILTESADGMAVNYLYDIVGEKYVVRMPAGGLRIGLVSVYG